MIKLSGDTRNITEAECWEVIFRPECSRAMHGEIRRLNYFVGYGSGSVGSDR